MNKKFTFMVAALLAAGSVFAANVEIDVDTPQEVAKAPKAYYYLKVGENTNYISSNVNPATGAITFGTSATISEENQDQFLWEVVVKNGEEVTLKNKKTGRNLAFNDAADKFVANVVEYSNGSALIDKFTLKAGELTFKYTKNNAESDDDKTNAELTFGIVDGNYVFSAVDYSERVTNAISLYKVENTDVTVETLKKLGQGFNLSFTGSPKGADVFTNLTVVAVKSEDEVDGEDADQFYLVKGKPVYKGEDLDMANNTFVVLSSTSAITGFEAPNGCTYTTVKGDKLVKVAEANEEEETPASHPNYKDGQYPLQNAIFTASENLNNAGKISLGQPAVYTVSSEAWGKSPNDVWVATAGNTGALVVCAQNSEDKAAWMATSLGTAVSVKDLVKGKMLVNVLTTAGEGYSSFDYILYDDKITDNKVIKFTTAASQMAGQKAYLTSQWYVSVGEENNTITLINRETGEKVENINLYSTAATGVYKAQKASSVVNEKYLKFVNVEGATQYDGYVNLSKEDLEEAYKLKTVARVSGFDVDVVLEQDYNSVNKHSDAAIKLKEKSDKEIQWKLAKATKKVEGADGKEVSVVDTVYQITKYKYYSADKLKEAADTLKIFKYNLTSANAVANEDKTILYNTLVAGYKFGNSKATTPATPKSVVLRKAGDKFVMAYAPEANNTLGDVLESTDKFAKNDPTLDSNQPKNEMTAGSYAAALRFSLEPVATAAQYDVPETHFALEVGGAYLGANAKETGILTNDTTMLKSTEVDASFSFYAFSADTAVAKRPSYYLSTNGKMMYNPADSISAIDKKIAALDKVFEADKIAALYAEKANYVNGDPKNPTDALVKFQQAKYVNADSIYVAGKGINGDALKPFKFNVEDVDGQAVLKNGDKYVAVVNGVAVLRGASDAAKFNVVDAATPTSNEAVSATEVKVVAQNGSVVVKNAAGKNVVVSTILGQVVANEVLTSDNATINVPAGIVIVSVEGESFKVNVK